MRYEVSYGGLDGRKYGLWRKRKSLKAALAAAHRQLRFGEVDIAIVHDLKTGKERTVPSNPSRSTNVA